MTHSKAFGREVQRLRKALGLSQAALAGIVGIDSTYLSRIERGEAAPPLIPKVIALADALGVARDALLPLSGRVPETPGEGDAARQFQVAAVMRSILPIRADCLEPIAALVEFLRIWNKIADGSHDIEADRTALAVAFDRFKEETAWMDRSVRTEILNLAMTKTGMTSGGRR